MKPVAIFRYSEMEGPGYFATLLATRRIPWQLVAIDQGAPIPCNAVEFSGLCLMGGPMSVNDDLPWIAPVCAVIRDAVRRNIPVIGHCLGGQLMSKALGGQIARNPTKEIGWGHVRTEDNESARSWLGPMLTPETPATVFQWHGETFSVPQDAERLLTNSYCANQAFAIGPHLAMQCHIEMTPEIIAAWCRSWADEVVGTETLPPSIQRPETITAETAYRLPAMRKLADQLYSVWIAGLSNE